MRELIRRVPQLHRLAVFDAVARAGDFTAAARDLGISQPAVSRHMSALAKELDLTLFERSGRSHSLTPRGQALADAVNNAFTSLERVLLELEDQQRAFVLAVQPAMATRWVVPLLDQLEATAETEIRLRIFERPSELESGDWDLAIVPGTGAWPDRESTLLFGEVVRPFASPSLAADLRLNAATDPLDLVPHNLLHIDETARPNMTWSEWFAEAAEPVELPTPRLKYNAYPTVLQEALAGNGIVLGWQHLLSDMVERGLLVPVGPIVRRKHGGHHVCWPKDTADDRHHSILNQLQQAIETSSRSFTLET